MDNNTFELLKVKIRKQDEHEEQVLSIDIHMEKQLIVTSDADGLIKIWNFQKKLIREIKFTEAITVVCFINNKADLMAGHGGKLSRIQADDYLPAHYRVTMTSHRSYPFGLKEIAPETSNQKLQKVPITLDEYFLQLKISLEDFDKEEHLKALQFKMFEADQ